MHAVTTANPRPYIGPVGLASKPCVLFTVCTGGGGVARGGRARAGGRSICVFVPPDVTKTGK